MSQHHLQVGSLSKRIPKLLKWQINDWFLQDKPCAILATTESLSSIITIDIE